MNHIESVVRTRKTIWAAREFKIVTLFDEKMEERFRKAALAYYRACEMNPTKNRCEIAAFIGSIHFDDLIPGEPGKKIGILRSGRRGGKLANIRQQLMAFSRVVSMNASAPNSLPGIGRAFRRDHSTVVYAVKKYGSAITQILNS